MIVLSQTPPTVNSLYPDRGGRRRKSGKYSKWLLLSGLEILTQNPQRYNVPVRLKLTYGFATKHRRDVFNFVKAVEDLLVGSGIIQDDSTKFVRGGEVWLAEDVGMSFVGVHIEIVEA